MALSETDTSNSPAFAAPAESSLSCQTPRDSPASPHGGATLSCRHHRAGPWSRSSPRPTSAGRGVSIAVNDFGTDLDPSVAASRAAPAAVQGIRVLGGQAIANGDDSSEAGIPHDRASAVTQ